MIKTNELEKHFLGASLDYWRKTRGTVATRLAKKFNEQLAAAIETANAYNKSIAGDTSLGR